MIFKIVKIFFILLFLVLANPTLINAQGSASLTLSPSSGTFNKGCDFSVNVNLNTNGAETDGTDVVLKYDPNQLSVNSITKGTIYSDYPQAQANSSTGTINISGIAQVDNPFSGSGVFATINFKTNSNAAAGTTKVSFDFDPANKEKTTDSNVVETGTVVDILNTVTDGTYTIGSGSCIGGTGSNQGATSTSSGTVDDMVGGTPGITTSTLLLTITGGILVVLGIVGLVLL
ncbi:hypothetical protein HYS91_00020 [Candidatus Daviesbacteria bacterium]|nr:hypothetical protein [Candidatus Daviesbacteria bacterium]